MENKTPTKPNPKPKKKIIVKKKSPEKDKIKKIVTTPTTVSENKEETITTTTTDKYLSQLSDIERKTMAIAENHLQSSFSLEKSIGYLHFVDSQTQP